MTSKEALKIAKLTCQMFEWLKERTDPEEALNVLETCLGGTLAMLAEDRNDLKRLVSEAGRNVAGVASSALKDVEQWQAEEAEEKIMKHDLLSKELMQQAIDRAMEDLKR